MAVVCLTATPAAAVDSHLLFNQDGWQLNHEVFARSGAQVCTVSRLNGEGDRFDIALWDHGRVELYLFMASDFDSWYGNFRAPALLTIDDSLWVFHNAEYEPYAISIGFPAGDQAGAFLKQLHDGDELALMTPTAQEVVTDWSLYGLAPAFAELAACRRRMAPDLPKS